jgi:solute:Na+ symporter, SSS family
VYKEFLRPAASPAEETRVARLVSLVMKVGALGFALELTKTFSINLQLLGGIWILQIFPVIVISLYTRWFHRFALLIGWAVAMVYGTAEAYRTPGNGQAHFGASTAPVFGHITYIAVTALALNLALSVLLTLVFRAMRLPDGYDETRPADYLADPAPGSAIPAGTAGLGAPPGATGGLPRTAFQAGPAGPGENNHSPNGAFDWWHPLRGGHGKHSTRNGH